MKEWLTIVLLALNGLLLLLFTCAAIAVGLLLLSMVPAVNSVAGDISGVRKVAEEKAAPIVDNIGKLTKAINEFKIFREQEEQRRR